MNNSLNIISKLNFEKSTEGNLSTTYNDENKYSSIVWSQTSTPKITSVNGVKVLNISTASQRIHTQALIYSKLIKDDNFQVEVDIELLELNIENAYFGFTVNYNKNIAFSIRNSFNKGLIISCGAVEIYCNYQFNKNTRYNILVSKKESEYSFMINGEAAGYVISEAFTNAISSTTTSFNMMLGASSTTTTDAMKNGNIYGLNVSIGTTFKYNAPFTEYGNNLVSSLRFGNASLNSTATSIASGIETIKDAKTWQFNSPISVSNEYLINNTTSFVNNIDSNYTLDFSIKNKKPLDNVNLFVNGPYTVKYTFIKIGQPEPQVIVNENTTSALDFENGIVDKVSTTVWTKEGTANVTSTNKIFGETSFETKALGDSLSTTSNIITGGITPFTIEFYALIGKQHGWTIAGYTQAPLFSKNGNSSSTNQQVHVNFAIGGKIQLEKQVNTGGGLTSTGNININYNEINKYTISYDGSAYRVFVNDKLDHSVGTLNAFNMNMNQPFTFLDSLVPSYSSYRTGIKGIIDNINIHDGIATKVRDYDPYEEFLVVDLAFDGENNSTKIVDNGSLKSKWSVNGNAKLSTAQKFDGFSSLYLDGSGDCIYNDKYFNLGIEDYTISLSFISLSNESKVRSIARTVTTPNNSYTFYLGIEADNTLKFLLYDYDISKAIINKSSTTIIDINKEYKVDVVCRDNIISMYINNKLEFSEIALNVRQDVIPLTPIYIGYSLGGSDNRYFSGYIKNFKIYKGVAVIPENPNGKIQLDFDNNVTDKYGNSTWTNNGVTFDQVNSVKGHAAYFNGVSGTMLESGINNNFNFTDNFLISLDAIKTADNIYPCMLGSATKIWQSNNQNPNISFHNSNTVNFSFNVNNVDVNNGLYGQAFKNNWYNFNLRRISNTLQLMINDTIQGVYNINNIVSSFNFNEGGGTRIGSAGWTAGNSQNFTGLIDNFKSIKDYKEQVVIDKPAVHLPLETNAINTGFTPLTINSVGSPTYTTVDGKKCIKFESGKYLTINSNNIFNLGTSSDFCIEFDFYLTSITKDNVLISNGSSFTGNTATILQTNNNVLQLFINNKWINLHTNILDRVFYNIAIHRKNNILQIKLNSEIISIDNGNVDFSVGQTNLGSTPWYGAANLIGYMSNFKMFVGTSEIPETYNDKKVLDLDFKPTRKSYLFKDNNNKCVIHPVNITQRDYQDSKYCCTFNGTNQYLQLGKNDLLNFGNDDFVINIKFKLNVINGWHMLLCDAASSTNFIDVGSSGYLAIKLGGLRYDTPVGSITVDTIYDVIIQVINSEAKVYINGELTTLDGQPSRIVSNVNFNLSGNTILGRYQYSNSEYLNGTIYSIKVLRNTTDLTLLEDGSEVPAQIEEKFVLSNGVDEEIISYESNEPRNIRIVKDETKASLIIDGEVIEVPTVENTDSEITLFDGYTGDIKDLKLYNAPLYSEDRFLGSEMIDTQFGEAEIDEVSDDYELYMGDFKIKGFIEGYTDRKFVIYDSMNDVILYNGIEDYEYNNLDENHIEYYFIKDLINNQTYPVNKHEMIKGYISGTVNLKQCGVKANDMEVYCYKSDTFRHIGTYLVDNNGRYNIPNLDVNTRYDIIFRDKTRRIKDQISNYRKPVIY